VELDTLIERLEKRQGGREEGRGRLLGEEEKASSRNW
jgi:hypothetical protein